MKKLFVSREPCSVEFAEGEWIASCSPFGDTGVCDHYICVLLLKNTLSLGPRVQDEVRSSSYNLKKRKVLWPLADEAAENVEKAVENIEQKIKNDPRAAESCLSQIDPIKLTVQRLKEIVTELKSSEDVGLCGIYRKWHQGYNVMKKKDLRRQAIKKRAPNFSQLVQERGALIDISEYKEFGTGSVIARVSAMASSTSQPDREHNVSINFKTGSSHCMCPAGQKGYRCSHLYALFRHVLECVEPPEISPLEAYLTNDEELLLCHMRDGELTASLDRTLSTFSNGEKVAKQLFASLESKSWITEREIQRGRAPILNTYSLTRCFAG